MSGRASEIGSSLQRSIDPAGLTITAAIPSPLEPDFRKVVEALPAAVYVTDAEGRITFFNEAAAALWGHRPALGESLWCGSWRLYSPDGTPMRREDCPM